MKYRQLKEQFDQWLHLQNFKANMRACTDAEGEVECVEVWANDFRQLPKDDKECCAPRQANRYESRGQYFVLNGVDNITEATFQDALEQLALAMN